MTRAPDFPANLLIVDDRRENLVALKALLSRPDYRITTAVSGTLALQLALREDFDLIVLDVQMPGMDGFEVATMLKQIERTRHPDPVRDRRRGGHKPH